MAESPAKEDVARTLLLRGSVFVHLDPRRVGVRVPEHLAEQPQLVLQVGLNLPIPIPDLRIDEEGVFGTLSFNRSPYTCEVPWAAVFGLVGDDGMGFVWDEDLPEEIAAEIGEATRAPAKPALRSIEGGASQHPPPADAPDERAGSDETEQNKGVRKAPHLRLIK